MEELNEAVRKIANDCAAKYPDDIDRAVDVAYGRFMNIPGYRRLVETAIRSHLRHMICDVRTETNRGIKRANGFYGGPAKVNPAESATLREISVSVYNLFIGNKTLGSLTGCELEAIAKGEREREFGHRLNAELIEWCMKQGVKENQRIRDAIPEAKLMRKFNRLQKENEDLSHAA